MTLRFLLDTNVLSAAMRPAPPAGLLERLDDHAGSLALPTIVWHELRFGVQRLPLSKRRNALESFLDDVVLPTITILAYDRSAAEWHANERARLETLGRPAPFADGQIAAIAATNGLTLVTDNIRDFDLYDDLPVENWLR